MDSGQKKVFHLHNLQQLREFKEPYSLVKITDPKTFVIFAYTPNDRTAPDDGHNVIVSSDGRRWKRTYLDL